jgi:hypothetical protein
MSAQQEGGRLTGAESSPALRLLRIGDPPDAWQALGFTVRGGGVQFTGISLELSEAGRGIVSWALTGIDPVHSVDGLITKVLPAGPPVELVEHANGAIGIDHVVVTTPDFDRTAAALTDAGLGLRRVRRSPDGRMMGFRRLGPAILEVVGVPSEDPEQPARFWGLVVVVPDLDALAGRLGQRLGPPKPAVQPGRRIATLKTSAGPSPAVAFMTPE